MNWPRSSFIRGFRVRAPGAPPAKTSLVDLVSPTLPASEAFDHAKRLPARATRTGRIRDAYDLHRDRGGCGRCQPTYGVGGAAGVGRVMAAPSSSAAAIHAVRGSA